MSVFKCVRRGGGYSVRCWWGCATGTLNPLPTDPYEMGIRPPVFEVLAFASLDQRNFTSNTPFCILDVWQSLIRVVVLHLLSRGKNFHSNKHSRDFTQDGLLSLRTTLGRNRPVRLTSPIHAHVICFCLFSYFNFQAEL